ASELQIVADAALFRQQRVAKALGVEAGAGRDDLREWIARVFVRISGERAERFKLADRFEPCAYVTTGLHAPGLDSKRKLRVVEQRRTDESHQLVIARVEQLHEPVQTGDSLGWWRPVGLELGAKLRQARRAELFALETGQDSREQRQIT